MLTHSLKLGEIEGTIETNIIPKIIDENIISCSFFYIKDVEDKYTESLSKFILDFKKNYFKDTKYKIRLYYDITTKTLVESRFKDIDYVQLYFYHFPHFFSKKNKSHYGLFGTIVRYFPFFSIPNHQAKNCWVFDIDGELKKFNYNIIDYVHKNKEIKLFHKTRLNYLSDRIILIKNRSYFSMLGGFMYQQSPISSNIITNFLNSINSKDKTNIYNEYLKELIAVMKKRLKLKMFYNKRINLNMAPFQYGVDEYFINRDFYNYYKNNNIPIHTIFYHTDILTGIKMHSDLLRLNEIKITPILKTYMNKVYYIINKNIKINSVEEYYNLIDKYLEERNKNKVKFEKNICRSKHFRQFFKKLNPKQIHMPNYIYKKIKLSFRYCFLKEMPILKYTYNKYEEITKIPFS